MQSSKKCRKLWSTLQSLLAMQCKAAAAPRSPEQCCGTMEGSVVVYEDVLGVESQPTTC